MPNGSQPPPQGPPIAWLFAILLGVVMAWPWIVMLLCDLAGVCLSSDAHSTGGWLTKHKTPEGGVRLIMGITAIGAGFRGLFAKKPTS